MKNKLNDYTSFALTIAKNAKQTLLDRRKSSQHKDSKTVLTGKDIDAKHDIIDHVHLEHRGELAYAVEAFADVSMSEYVLPIIEDMFEEGVQIGFIPTGISADDASALKTAEQVQQHTAYQTVFIPFRFSSATFEERLFYLIYESAIRIGKSLEDSHKRYFEVVEKSYPSPNMLRLHIKSDMPLPKDSPGFAFGLVLNRMNADDMDSANKTLPPLIDNLWKKIRQQSQNIPLVKTSSDKLINRIKQSELTDKIYKQAYLTMFEIFKLLPNTQREKVQRQSGKHQVRYYTLRQAFTDTNNGSLNNRDLNNSHTNNLDSNKSDASHVGPNLGDSADGCHAGYIDVYIHGDTPAGNWAKSLQAGDIIASNRDVEETTEQLQQGQSLLICDETAMPTVALCLETWQSDTIPLVICIHHSADEQSYWQSVNYAATLPKSFKPVFIGLKTDDDSLNYAEEVIAQIDEFTKKTGNPIDHAWGAFEAGQAKQVKKHLRETYALKGRANAVRGYWKKTAA